MALALCVPFRLARTAHCTLRLQQFVRKQLENLTSFSLDRQWQPVTCHAFEEASELRNAFAIFEKTSGNMRKLDAKNLSEKPTNMKYYEGGSMRFITSMTTTRLDVLHESTKNENIHEKNVQEKNQEKLKNAKALRI